MILLGRFDKWAIIELKLLLKELLDKKIKNDEDLEMIDNVKEELKKRGVKYEQSSNSG